MIKILVPAYQRVNILEDLMLVAKLNDTDLKTYQSPGPFYYEVSENKAEVIKRDLVELGITYN